MVGGILAHRRRGLRHDGLEERGRRDHRDASSSTGASSPRAARRPRGGDVASHEFLEALEGRARRRPDAGRTARARRADASAESSILAEQGDALVLPSSSSSSRPQLPELVGPLPRCRCRSRAASSSSRPGLERAAGRERGGVPHARRGRRSTPSPTRPTGSAVSRTHRAKGRSTGRDAPRHVSPTSRPPACGSPPYVHRTPVLTSATPRRAHRRALFFKCETFQKVGAFKARGRLLAADAPTSARESAGGSSRSRPGTTRRPWRSRRGRSASRRRSSCRTTPRRSSSRRRVAMARPCASTTGAKRAARAIAREIVEERGARPRPSVRRRRRHRGPGHRRRSSSSRTCRTSTLS